LPRRRRCAASWARKKRRPPPTHPHLKIVDNSRLRPAPKVAVSRVFQGFSRHLPPHPALSRISQISCLPTATDRAELSKLLHISDTQLSYITNAEAGHGLLRMGGSIVPFVNTIPRDTELYKLMTTTPGENLT
jgi:hypothetical protein